MQLSVSSKAGGLEKGHLLSSEGVCHGVAPSFSWSSSGSPAKVLGVVCTKGSWTQLTASLKIAGQQLT